MAQIERHDIGNALALTVVLLICGYFIVNWSKTVVNAAAGGFWDIENVPEEPLPIDVVADARFTGQHPPNEVVIIVGNASDGIDGLAGRSTSRLIDQGYLALDPANVDGEPMDSSIIYFVEQDFEPDAQAVAALLGLSSDFVTILKPDIELAFNATGADVIVILGNDAE